MDEVEKEPADYTIINNCDESLKIEFTNLKYVARMKKDASLKVVLRNITGSFNPRRLTGIIGSSGAGKTSLLNVISGFKHNGVSGSITVNGQPRNMRAYKKQCCYVEQEFTLFPLLTTKESLIIAADMKLGHYVKNTVKNRIINEILYVMKLENTSNTLVKHLSGGEKRRLSVGIEIITNPPIMLFDEPTSGLDASSSIEVIHHLKLLAKENRTIVCVIHQLSSRIFDTLDDILVLNDGKIMYSGPAAEIVSSFLSAGFVCPKYYNPADFVIELSKSHPFLEVKPILQSDMKERAESFQRNFYKTDDIFRSRVQESGVIHQCWILSKRAHMVMKRDLYVTYFKILLYFILGATLGVFWFDVGNEADKVLSNIPLIYIAQIASYVIPSLLTTITYGKESQIITREHRNNWYSVSAYFLSKFIAQLPLQVINSTVLLLPVYILSGQILEMWRLFMTWIVFVLMAVIGEYKGLLFGTMFKPEVAMNIILGMGLICATNSGFLLRLNDIPIYARWFSQINIFRLSFESCVVNIYGQNRTHMDCHTSYCYFRSPRKVLEEWHMENVSVEWNITGLILWILVLQTLFFCALKWKQRESQ